MTLAAPLRAEDVEELLLDLDDEELLLDEDELLLDEELLEVDVDVDVDVLLSELTSEDSSELFGSEISEESTVLEDSEGSLLTGSELCVEELLVEEELLFDSVSPPTGGVSFLPPDFSTIARMIIPTTTTAVPIAVGSGIFPNSLIGSFCG